MTRIMINRGADRTLWFAWKSSDGKPIALASTELFQVARGLEGRVSLVDTDLASGEFMLKLEGTEPLRPRSYDLWIQVFDLAGDSHTTKVEFHVQ